MRQYVRQAVFILIILKLFIIYFVVVPKSVTSRIKSFFSVYNSHQNTSGIQEQLPWHKKANKFENLNENIIYAKFNIKKAKKRKKLNIIAIVSSAPNRKDRRDAIRDTWWKQCKSTVRVSIKCMFLTDWKNLDTKLGKDLLFEANKYGDLYFQNLTGGYDFGMRFLYHMVWSMQNINFDYFLRLDDDYFVCMERFLDEVPMPPKKLYHWGWVHCSLNIVRPEESIILLSRDVIEIFLGQDPEKMLCNRWADQMIGIWNNELNLPKLYHHDNRLHHHPPARDIKSFKSQENICTDYIGVHGSYPIQMRTLWKNKGPKNYNKNNSLENFSSFCMYDSVMDWKSFEPYWRVEPKLCKTNPNWGGPFGTTYIGREGS
ncbi:uncharacterized protein LOC101236165 isoform X1 [Hydra vulgaris]|uniref:Hexosyltransferase n=1 Tax=Hydra vulgaris TaxID=6087 RepID=A0ABM4CDL1_HYDVU